MILSTVAFVRASRAWEAKPLANAYIDQFTLVVIKRRSIDVKILVNQSRSAASVSRSAPITKSKNEHDVSISRRHGTSKSTFSCPSTPTLTDTSSNSSAHPRSLTLAILVLTTCSQTSNLIMHGKKARKKSSRAPGRELCEAIYRMRLYQNQQKARMRNNAWQFCSWNHTSAEGSSSYDDGKQVVDSSPIYGLSQAFTTDYKTKSSAWCQGKTKNFTPAVMEIYAAFNKLKGQKADGMKDYTDGSQLGLKAPSIDRTVDHPE
ncbi:hypothetical protein VNO77_02330 [Canavalia gladiata]|uniref:Uncharacterized protein n=1 Tax=Canavalia gladiata TaxID=3824 RepID=A0AAN9MT20_CANGL